jgi:enoyl-CoA hydratase/carnithine racemase
LVLAVHGSLKSNPAIMNTMPLLLRDEAPWGVRLTLNRPAKLNAISAELRDALTSALADAAADDRVRVIVIAGAGRAFCSGYDLSEAAPPTAWDWRDVLARDVDATLAVWSCPKPVIAQVHGYALAGGLELAMACDLIVADPIGFPASRRGIAMSVFAAAPSLGPTIGPIVGGRSISHGGRLRRGKSP